MIHVIQSNAQDLIIACIREAAGKEICGFLVQKEREQEFLLIPNIAYGNHSFFISDWDYARVKAYCHKRASHIIALIHSHESILALSEGDMPCFMAGTLPWIIVSFNDSTEFRYEVFYPPDCSLSWRHQQNLAFCCHEYAIH